MLRTLALATLLLATSIAPVAASRDGTQPATLLDARTDACNVWDLPAARIWLAPGEYVAHISGNARSSSGGFGHQGTYDALFLASANFSGAQVVAAGPGDSPVLKITTHASVHAFFLDWSNIGDNSGYFDVFIHARAGGAFVTSQRVYAYSNAVLLDARACAVKLVTPIAGQYLNALEGAPTSADGTPLCFAYRYGGTDGDHHTALCPGDSRIHARAERADYGLYGFLVDFDATSNNAGIAVLTDAVRPTITGGVPPLPAVIPPGLCAVVCSWTEDFESYPIGSTAASGGWEKGLGGQAIVTNDRPYQGSKSYRMTAYPYWALSAHRAVGSAPLTSIEIETMLNIQAPVGAGTANVGFMPNSGIASPWVASADFRPGGIVTIAAEGMTAAVPAGNWSPNQWIKVRLTLVVPTALTPGRLTVALNDQAPISTDLPPRTGGNIGRVATVAIGAGVDNHQGATTVWFDNVRATSVGASAGLPPAPASITGPGSLLFDPLPADHAGQQVGPIGVRRDRYSYDHPSWGYSYGRTTLSTPVGSVNAYDVFYADAWGYKYGYVGAQSPAGFLAAGYYPCPGGTGLFVYANTFLACQAIPAPLP